MISQSGMGQVNATPPSQPNSSWLKSSVGKTITNIGIVIGIAAGIVTIYDQIDNSEDKVEQSEKLKVAHSPAKKVIANWNQVEDLSKNKAHAMSVKSDIETIVINYEKLRIDQLSKLTSVVYKWHLAKLYNIQADVQFDNGQKDDSLALLKKAIKLLNQAKLIIDDTKDFTAIEMTYISDKDLVNRLNRTLLVSLALSIDTKINETAKNVERATANELLKSFGGCEKLEHLNTRHIRILRSLSCSAA